MSNSTQNRSSLGAIGSGKASAKSEKDQLQDVLAVLLREEDNKYCADCEGKSPRWASWNLGVFICIRCAGIHRKLGVHISRVKSVNLDSWTLDQVACIATIGNTLARAAYEANLPNGFRRPNSDAGMEQFIKAKYEERRYLVTDFKPPKPDTSVVYALLKSPANALQQQQPTQQQQSKFVLSRPLPAPNSAATAQIVAQPPPPPMSLSLKPLAESQSQPQKPPPDLLLIGVEESPIAALAPSPDSDFGNFSAPPQPSTGRPSHGAVNPDLIFDDNGTTTYSGGWPSVGAEFPKKSAKDSIMALYGNGQQQAPQQQQPPPFILHPQAQYLQQQTSVSGMHYSASSPMLTAGLQQHQQQQHPGFYLKQQQQVHPAIYSQTAGTLIYSSGMQSHQLQQQPQQHGASTFPVYSQPQQQSAGLAGNQTTYLQQVQSQMANMGFSGTSRTPQQQESAAANNFPADIWK